MHTLYCLFAKHNVRFRKTIRRSTTITVESKMNISSLPGEIQNMIIRHLHPSAAVALGHTNRYFHSISSLHILPISIVEAFLEERIPYMLRMDNYLCASCFHSKPPERFLESQITEKRSKEGSERNLRRCLDCMKEQISPGSIVELGKMGQKHVLCMACVNFRSPYCVQCRWCSVCACLEGEILTYRKAADMDPKTPDWIVPVTNTCEKHLWSNDQELMAAARGEKTEKRGE